MTDRPLATIRAEIESLATPDGRYVLVCARTRERPTPTAGLAFATRADAAAAARLTEQYRSALREYDPAVAFRDVVACERPALRARPSPSDAATTDGATTDGAATDDAAADGAAADGADPLRIVDLDSDHDGALPDEGAADDLSTASRVRFCHRLATALFEALRSAEHDAVERAVMDTYRSAAERVADPDALCLRLIDEIAIELHERLAPAEQVAVCSDAAARLPSPPTVEDYAVVAAFERLVTVDLLEAFTVSPWFQDDASGAETCAVEVRDYALWPRDAAITTLPITVDVLRRQPTASVAIDPAVRLGDRSWEFRVATRRDAEPTGVARVPLAV